LYAERFPIFIKISLIAYAPLIALVLLNHYSDKLIPWVWMAQHHISPTLVAILLILASFLSQMAGHSVIRAVTVPIVLQSIIAPLRPVKIRTAFSALKRRWGVFTVTTLIVFIATIIGIILLVLPGLTIATIFALVVPVVMMEDLGIKDTLVRSFHLMKRSWAASLAITV
jgi:hypothetical protein